MVRNTRRLSAWRGPTSRHPLFLIANAPLTDCERRSAYWIGAYETPGAKKSQHAFPSADSKPPTKSCPSHPWMALAAHRAAVACNHHYFRNGLGSSILTRMLLAQTAKSEFLSAQGGAKGLPSFGYPLDPIRSSNMGTEQAISGNSAALVVDIRSRNSGDCSHGSRISGLKAARSRSLSTDAENAISPALHLLSDHSPV